MTISAIPANLARMVAVYIIVLCFSAAFAAFVTARIAGRVAHLMGRETVIVSGGIFAILSTIAFLIVVAVPAMVLVGTLLLLGASLLSARPAFPIYAAWGTLVIALFLGMATVTTSAIGPIPALGVTAIAALLWLGVTYGGSFIANRLPAASVSLLVPCIPLLVAPLFHAPSSIALDSALLLSALAGATFACDPADRLASARTPFAFLLGWLIVQAGIHGAWPCALASLIAWSGAIAYAAATPGSRADALSAA